MNLTLPKIFKLVDEIGSNQIWHFLGEQKKIDNVQIISTTPFAVQSLGVNYLLTSDKNHQDDTIDYILLTSKIPRRADFNAGRINIQRWLKHPLFQNITPEDVVATWVDKFKFIKETINGLGRRKTAVARVYLKSGKGTFIVNGNVKFIDRFCYI